MKPTNFREHLYHKTSDRSIKAHIDLIESYLGKKTGKDFIGVPLVEHIIIDGDEVFGLRFLIEGTKKSIRFNWSDQSLGVNLLESISIFDSKNNTQWILMPDNNKLSHNLPLAADVLKGRVQEGDYITVLPESLNEELYEDESDLTASNLFEFLIKNVLTQDRIIDPPTIREVTGGVGVRLMKSIQENFGELFDDKNTFIGNKRDRKEIMKNKSLIFESTRSASGTIQQHPDEESTRCETVESLQNQLNEKLVYGLQDADESHFLRMIARKVPMMKDYDLTENQREDVVDVMIKEELEVNVERMQKALYITSAGIRHGLSDKDITHLVKTYS